MIVTASTPGGLMNACLDAIQRLPVQGTDPVTVVQPVAPPGGGTSLPEASAPPPSAVVSPLSATLARQAYQAQAAAGQRAQLVG